mmetsp:Transcript_40650/g.105534  ORF Transcript_40650/g.105534 Transcript_40650/m.105534 type:complete len:229 (+) Transcript_40650:426-1112(+)
MSIVNRSPYSLSSIFELSQLSSASAFAVGTISAVEKMGTPTTIRELLSSTNAKKLRREREASSVNCSLAVGNALSRMIHIPIQYRTVHIKYAPVIKRSTRFREKARQRGRAQHPFRLKQCLMPTAADLERPAPTTPQHTLSIPPVRLCSSGIRELSAFHIPLQLCTTRGPMTIDKNRKLPRLLSACFIFCPVFISRCQLPITEGKWSYSRAQYQKGYLCVKSALFASN